MQKKCKKALPLSRQSLLVYSAVLLNFAGGVTLHKPYRDDPAFGLYVGAFYLVFYHGYSFFAQLETVLLDVSGEFGFKRIVGRFEVGENGFVVVGEFYAEDIGELQ